MTMAVNAPPVHATAAAPGGGAFGPSPHDAALPPPKASPMGEDALYTMMTELADAQTEIGKGQAERAHAEKKHAIEEFRRALEEQREAEQGGFLGKLGLADVAKVATIVVAVAAVAVTGGASLAVAGALLSAGAFAVEKTKCFGDASQWVALGMSAGGGIMTGCGVAAEAAAAADAARTAAAASDAAALGAAATGGAGGFAGATAASVATTTTEAMAANAALAATRTFSNIELGVEAGTHILLGAETIETAVVAHKADKAGIEAKEAQNELARLERVFDRVIDDFKDAKQSRQRASDGVSAIKETEGQTLLIAAGARA
jgi:hypothetical protein